MNRQDLSTMYEDLQARMNADLYCRQGLALCRAALLDLEEALLGERTLSSNYPALVTGALDNL